MRRLRTLILWSVFSLSLAGCVLPGSQAVNSAQFATATPPAATVPINSRDSNGPVSAAAISEAAGSEAATAAPPQPTPPTLVSSPQTAPPSATPLPSPTPAPTLQRLTDGSCCVAPFWSPGGGQVLFIDKPAPDAPSGLWSVDLEGNPPEFFTDQLGIYAPDMSKRAFLQNGTTFVEDLTSGERWSILNGGRAVSFSPDGTQLAWTAGQAGPPFDSARREVWVSYYDGTEAGNVYTTPGGGFSDWFPDGRLLVSSRLQAPESGQVYWALTPGNAEQPELLEVGRGGRLREPAMSADGSWLAYLVSFSDDPNLDGLWIANTHTGERRRLDVFGAYRWRDDQRLLVVPLDLSQPFHHLLQVEAASGSITALTDPQATPFKIAAGDWSVSPDGQRVVFVSAEDGNIWLLNLPPGP